MAVDILQPKEHSDANNNVVLNDDNNVEVNNNKKNERLTPFAKLTRDLTEDERCAKEYTLGKRIGFYRIQGDLGRGNFAKVKLAYHCLVKEKVAIKILDKTKLDEKTQKLLSREILSMEKLHHPNIIRIFEVLETICDIYIVMEYASSGELFHKVLNDGKFQERVAKNYFAQLVSAVQHMHQSNIIHRDIKAENVFLATNGVVKLGDLGFSTIALPDEQLNTFCGSPPYAAPELFKDDHYLGHYVDIWALGILLYFMVTGAMPFRADTVGKLKRKILEGSFIIPEHVTDTCRFMIRQMLRLVPSDRFSIPEIMRSIWLEGVHFPKPLKSYNLTPSLTDNNLSQDEIQAIEQITSYGVTKAMIEQCPANSRNNINGTYRIAVYQVGKRAIERQLENEAMLKRDMEILRQQKPKKFTRVNTNTMQSKFCTLL